MPIDVQKINPVDYCVLVAWLHGFSIGQISKSIGQARGKSAASIRGIVNKKMKISRSEMSLRERQDALDSLKEKRIDDDVMPDKYFTAVPLKLKSHVKPLGAYKKEKPRPPVFENTPKGRKAKKLHLKEEKKREKEAEELRLKSQYGLNESRGLNAAAFEYMLGKGLLLDPEEIGTYSNVVKREIPSEMRRDQAAIKFRKIMADKQFSALKSQNFEAAGGGGGGMGVAIPARISEATSIMRALKQMMSSEDMAALESVVINDDFIWLNVESEIAMKIRLEDVRRALDIVALFLNLIDEKTFKIRWGYVPAVPDFVKSRGQARRENNTVREMIHTAQKAMK